MQISSQQSWSRGATEVEVQRRGRGAKRIMDVTLGSIFAVCALPVIAILAVGVVVSFRAWPFFVHTRIGYRGKPFRMIKLRTLPRSAPRYAAKTDVIRLKTTRFGSWLRRSKLDELPQLLMVPFGKMSLVGPRPEMPHLHDRMPPGLATARVSVRPGCTGLWQLSAQAGRMISDSPTPDLTYIRQRTLRLDFWLVWQTALRLLGNRRAIEMSRVAMLSRPADSEYRDRVVLPVISSEASG